MPEKSAAKAVHAVRALSAGVAPLAASNFFCQWAGEAMNRLVRFSGRKASGSLVVSSTVRSSILRALRSVGMREAVTPTWLASKCGASLSITLRTFHTTASALNALPSWNFTPGRSLNTHLVLSLASTAQLRARPGISTLGLSALERSQPVSASYMGMPVKRLPSKPWSGWPSVRGMSAAVIAMRSTFSWASALPAAPTASMAATSPLLTRPEVLRPGVPIRFMNDSC